MTFKKPALAPSGLIPEIIGTDLDHTILNRAKEGVYTQFEAQRGLSVQLLMQHFTQLEAYGDRWQLNDDIRDMVTFKHANLIEPFHEMGQFDIIFCRNVLIYFEQETKQDIVRRLARCLTPHGLLFLGSTESLSHIEAPLVPFKKLNAVYALNNS